MTSGKWHECSSLVTLRSTTVMGDPVGTTLLQDFLRQSRLLIVEHESSSPQLSQISRMQAMKHIVSAYGEGFKVGDCKLLRGKIF